MLPESPARTREDRRRKDKADREKAQRLAAEVAEQEQEAHCKTTCERILQLLEEEDVPFIELLRHVSDPSYYQGKQRYWGLFRHTEGVKDILNMWVSSGNSATGRDVVQEWAVEHISSLLAREGVAASKDGFLRTEKRPVDETFALDFELGRLSEKLEEQCPITMQILSALSTSSRQRRRNTFSWRRRRQNYITTCALICLSARSQKNNYSRCIFGLYAYTAGAKRQVIELLSHIGVCCSYSALVGNLGDDTLADLEDEDAATESALPVSGAGMENLDADSSDSEDEEDVPPTAPPSPTSTHRPHPVQPPSSPTNSIPPVVSPPNSHLRNVPSQADVNSHSSDSLWDALDHVLAHERAASGPGSEADQELSAVIEDLRRESQEEPARNNDSGGGTAQSMTKKKKRVEGILKRLSDACRRAARANASSRLLAFVYDNINMVFRIAEQILGHKDSQENGTCATAFELYGATEEAMQTSDLISSFMDAPPLALDVILFSTQESQDFRELLQLTVLRIIVTHGGDTFARFRAQVDAFGPLLDTRIPLHRTNIYPLPSMKIDESTIVGNADVTKAVLSELGKDMSSPDFGKIVQVIAGDQLSIARLRSLTRNRSGHDSFPHSFLWALVMPGIFHYKMAATHGIMELFYGRTTSHRNPGSLAFHNTVLDHLIFVSLYARILVCLEIVTGSPDLDEYGQTVTWDQLKHDASETSRTAELRAQADKAASSAIDEDNEPGPRRLSQGDMVFENAILFMRDALVLRALTDAVKMGVSGRLVLLLKALGLIYRGSGRTKYAQEVLFLVHNLTHVWPEELRNIMLNNWLVNPTGRESSWVEVDLLQEHMNYWIKRTARTRRGSGWRWSRRASTSCAVSPPSSTTHWARNKARSTQALVLTESITVLMQSLRQHRMYVLDPGREIDDDKAMVPDSYTMGLELLEGPLDEFNRSIARLQARCQSTPLVGARYPGTSPSLTQAAQTNEEDGEVEGRGNSTNAREDVDASAKDSVDDASDDKGDDARDEHEPQAMFSLDTAGDVALDPDLLEDFEFGV
ncbi:hypothetical protein EVJ58_g5477 [Rhodofomes roseus]|uniref:DUF6589 domain-containing protein n=1 Tax=Rhodofomes roseus TaxID=34475 RepID=A0A4Y9YEA2_9APHY|nr:hypothetical protein EVJ58_g5477 [Rhodofomes roseus]